MQSKPVRKDRLRGVPSPTEQILRQPRPGVIRANGPLPAIPTDALEKLLPIAICVLLVFAAVVSTLPSAHPVSASNVKASPTTAAVIGGNAPARPYGVGDGPNAPDVNDLYFGDGSISNVLQNRVAGADARTLLTSYIVKNGDTLAKIAAQFGLASTTIYWANKSAIPDPGKLHIGQAFLIPPMDGLIVKIGPKDSLASLAKKYKIDEQDIIDANNLPEASVVLGEAVIIPGASGGPIPKPAVVRPYVPPARSWRWPLGGNWEITQLYWAGHRAVDIATSYGSPVYAAMSGRVVLSGWRSYTGGGNVIWVETGPKLYETYNHLSKWYVSPGQSVRAGQLIGRVGTSGVATGPHLHFEIWLGEPWALGNNSDAINPCRYLPNC